jgi:hypothetical protein
MPLTPREKWIAAYFTAFGVMIGAAIAWTGFVTSGLRI